MINLKLSLVFVFSFLCFGAYAHAEDAIRLNVIKASDISALNASLQIPTVPQVPSIDVLNNNFFARYNSKPVIITVPGLKFNQIGPQFIEIDTIVSIFRYFFPKSNRDDIRTILKPEHKKAMVDYLMLDSKDAANFLPASKTRLPDNYLEESMKRLPGYAAGDVTIEPFNWSRDPDDSKEYVTKLIDHISSVYTKYKNTGRPIVIVSHSWGTMLSHTALHRLPEVKSNIKIDKWITMGSPLMPGNIVVKLYIKLGVKLEDLEKRVNKPSSVSGLWINIWAKNDLVSNAIRKADYNQQIDAAIEPYEASVIKTMKNDISQSVKAHEDLFKLRNTSLWHDAYQDDYHVYLKSLMQPVDIYVFQPFVTPLVLDYF